MSDDEHKTLYEEVRQMEGHIQHVTEKLRQLDAEQGATPAELREQGLSQDEIKALQRYSKVMHAIANKVMNYREGTDDDDDDGGDDFRVDDTLY